MGRRMAHLITMNYRRNLLAAAVAALVSVSSAAYSQLPPAFDASFRETLQPTDTGGEISRGTPGTIRAADNGITTVATALGGGDPSVFAEASGSVNTTTWNVVYAQGNAGITYFFEINGPGPSMPVPVDITGTLSTFIETDGQTTPLAGAAAIVEITPASDIFDRIGGWGVESPLVISASSSASMDSTLDFNTGTPYEVSMMAYTSVGNLTIPGATGISGTAEASIDPSFVIDPGFLSDHPGFTLDFSPNLNTPPTTMNPVPEPSGWGTIAGALALFFVGVRFCRGSQKLPQV
jgi:hypothetical protein